MNPRRFAQVTTALCGTVGLAGWVVASLTGVGSVGIENAGAVSIEDHPSPSLTAEVVDAPQATASGNITVASADVAAVAESVTGTAADTTAASDQPKSILEAALPDSSQVLPPETPPVQVATANTPDPVLNDAKEALNTIETLEECLVADICIDRFLWALYQRAPGGMDRSFKLKLFHTLHAAEQAGLSPGITSAFRDDYRQSIASGLKAATDRSYHGGSSRGGYGHGLAADVVSVKGATRAERWVSTDILWKWIDAHGKEFGIGRPYLDRDPPHVAPIDGREYVSRRGGAKTQEAEAKTKTRVAEATIKKGKRLAARADHSAAKRARNV